MNWQMEQEPHLHYSLTFLIQMYECTVFSWGARIGFIASGIGFVCALLQRYIISNYFLVSWENPPQIRSVCVLIFFFCLQVPLRSWKVWTDVENSTPFSSCPAVVCTKVFGALSKWSLMSEIIVQKRRKWRKGFEVNDPIKEVPA